MKIEINVGCTAFEDGGFTDRLAVANDNSRELAELARAINDMFHWGFDDGPMAGGPPARTANRAGPAGTASPPIPMPAQPTAVLNWPIIPRPTP